MQFESGMILEGKVTGIAAFGAFVELPNGKTGLVHISEVSTEYVNDVKFSVQKTEKSACPLSRLCLKIQRKNVRRKKMQEESREPTMAAAEGLRRNFPLIKTARI